MPCVTYMLLWLTSLSWHVNAKQMGITKPIVTLTLWLTSPIHSVVWMRESRANSPPLCESLRWNFAPAPIHLWMLYQRCSIGKLKQCEWISWQRISRVLHVEKRLSYQPHVTFLPEKPHLSPAKNFNSQSVCVENHGEGQPFWQRHQWTFPQKTASLPASDSVRQHPVYWWQLCNLEWKK